MPARTIIESAEAEEVLKSLNRKYPRFGDVWLAWSWRLARGPDIDCVPVPRSNRPAYLIKLPDLSLYDIPIAITILYHFTDDEVEIIAVRVSD